MLVIGRLTRNATVKSTTEGKEVVEFSVAENHFYRKDDEKKQVTTYYNCSYWINTKVAERLIKGALVEVYGSLIANAYQSQQGEPRASLNLHVDVIRIHQTGNAIPVNGAGINMTESKVEVLTERIDDLPF